MNMADALTAIDRGNDPLHFRPARRTFLQASAAAGVSGLVASFSEVVGAAEPVKPGEGVFDLGDMVLRFGETLRNAQIAYKTHGRLAADKSNVILYPTPYSAQHGDIEWLIGPGKALDPDKYFIDSRRPLPRHSVGMGTPGRQWPESRGCAVRRYGDQETAGVVKAAPSPPRRADTLVMKSPVCG